MRSKVRRSEAAGSFAPGSRPNFGGTRPWARHRALCPAPAPPQASVSTTDLHRKAQILPLGSSYGPGSLAQKPCGPGFPAPRDSLLPQSPPQVGYLILSSHSPPGYPAPTKHLSCAAFPGGVRRNAGRDLEAGPGSSKPGGGARLSRKPISTREVPAGPRASGAGRSLLGARATASAAVSG